MVRQPKRIHISNTADDIGLILNFQNNLAARTVGKDDDIFQEPLMLLRNFSFEFNVLSLSEV